MPATLTAQSTRLDGVLDLPMIVLRRYHSRFVTITLHVDSEGVNDLIAEGNLKLVQLDQKLPQDMDPLDFRLRCMAVLRKFYLRFYFKSRGESWRKKTNRMERRSSPEVHFVPFDNYAINTAVAKEDGDTPETNAMWNEAQEFLDGLGTAKARGVRQLMNGLTKNEVAADMGMCVKTLNEILGNAVDRMRKGGVL